MNNNNNNNNSSNSRNESESESNCSNLDSLELEKDIQQLRSAFLEEYEINPHLYDEEDIEKVKESDLWLTRFITFLNQGSEKGLEHMKDVFRWRKSFGINSFNPLEIPQEIYEMGPVSNYARDKDGNRNLIMRVKMHRKIPFLEDRIKQSVMNYVEEIDQKSTSLEHNWNLVLDMTGSSIANADLDMLFFFMPSVRRYYPNAVKHVFVTGLPWILNSVARFAVAFMPSDTAKKIKFVTQEELTKYIDADQLPDFLGGHNQDIFRIVPKGARSCVELGQELYDLTEDEVTKLMRPSLKFIEEGRLNAMYL